MVLQSRSPDLPEAIMAGILAMVRAVSFLIPLLVRVNQGAIVLTDTGTANLIRTSVHLDGGILYVINDPGSHDPANGRSGVCGGHSSALSHLAAPS
jgi:hypothetical protein